MDPLLACVDRACGQYGLATPASSSLAILVVTVSLSPTLQGDVQLTLLSVGYSQQSVNALVVKGIKFVERSMPRGPNILTCTEGQIDHKHDIAMCLLCYEVAIFQHKAPKGLLAQVLRWSTSASSLLLDKPLSQGEGTHLHILFLAFHQDIAVTCMMGCHNFYLFQCCYFHIVPSQLSHNLVNSGLQIFYVIMHSWSTGQSDDLPHVLHPCFALLFVSYPGWLQLSVTVIGV